MQSKRKILTIVYDLGVGGTQRAAQNFAVAYHHDGHESRVLPVYEDGPRKNELLNLGIYVYSHGNNLDESLILINQWLPDIIHIHRSGEADTYLSNILQTLKKEKTKVIETNVFSVSDNSEQAGLIDVHCHLSEWCIWRWTLFIKKKSLGVVIPYLVLSDNFFKETNENKLNFKKRMNLPLDKFIFGRIGQKSPAKFHQEIYNSFERLFTIRQDIHLLIVGLPSQYLSEVYSLNSFKMGAITLIESIVGDSELRLAYNSLDCFLHYSNIGESFGMVLAEAQLCEVPVISVSTPKADNSQLEVLIHEKSAIIVKNDRLISDVMGQFADGVYSRFEYGKVGRKHILTHFTPEILIPRLNYLFSLLLSEKNSTDAISNFFITNLKTVSVDHLKNLGYGNYSFSNQLFLLMPKYYLIFANLAFVVKKKIKALL